MARQSSEGALLLESAETLSRRGLYDRRGKVGKGAFGDVFLVYQRSGPRVGQPLVLKSIKLARQNDWQRQATHREIGLMAMLQHPFVVPFVDQWLDNGHTVNVVLGYCAQGDLGAVMTKRQGKLFEEEQLKGWLVQMLLALHYLESKGVMHRDIKPSNIFLHGDGYVQLGDFGLASLLDDNEGHDQNLVGTPHFMSPEMLGQRGYSYATDIWSLGCCFYELSAQKPPFNAFNLNGLVGKIQKRGIPPLPSVFSPTWGALINSMLKKDPSQRPTILDLLAAPCLRAALEDTYSLAAALMPQADLPAMPAPLEPPAATSPPSSPDSPGSACDPAELQGMQDLAEDAYVSLRTAGRPAGQQSRASSLSTPAGGVSGVSPCTTMTPVDTSFGSDQEQASPPVVKQAERRAVPTPPAAGTPRARTAGVTTPLRGMRVEAGAGGEGRAEAAAGRPRSVQPRRGRAMAGAAQASPSTPRLTALRCSPVSPPPDRTPSEPASSTTPRAAGARRLPSARSARVGGASAVGRSYEPPGLKARASPDAGTPGSRTAGDVTCSQEHQPGSGHKSPGGGSTPGYRTDRTHVRCGSIVERYQARTADRAAAVTAGPKLEKDTCSSVDKARKDGSSKGSSGPGGPAVDGPEAVDDKVPVQDQVVMEKPASGGGGSSADAGSVHDKASLLSEKLRAIRASRMAAVQRVASADVKLGVHQQGGPDGSAVAGGGGGEVMEAREVLASKVIDAQKPAAAPIMVFGGAANKPRHIRGLTRAVPADGQAKPEQQPSLASKRRWAVTGVAALPAQPPPLPKNRRRSVLGSQGDADQVAVGGGVDPGQVRVKRPARESARAGGGTDVSGPPRKPPVPVLSAKQDDKGRSAGSSAADAGSASKAEGDAGQGAAAFTLGAGGVAAGLRKMRQSLSSRTTRARQGMPPRAAGGAVVATAQTRPDLKPRSSRTSPPPTSPTPPHPVSPAAGRRTSTSSTGIPVAPMLSARGGYAAVEAARRARAVTASPRPQTARAGSVVSPAARRMSSLDMTASPSPPASSRIPRASADDVGLTPGPELVAGGTPPYGTPTAGCASDADEGITQPLPVLPADEDSEARMYMFANAMYGAPRRTTMGSEISSYTLSQAGGTPLTLDSVSNRPGARSRLTRDSDRAAGHVIQEDLSYDGLMGDVLLPAAEPGLPQADVAGAAGGDVLGLASAGSGDVGQLEAVELAPMPVVAQLPGSRLHKGSAGPGEQPGTPRVNWSTPGRMEKHKGRAPAESSKTGQEAADGESSSPARPARISIAAGSPMAGLTRTARSTSSCAHISTTTSPEQAKQLQEQLRFMSQIMPGPSMCGSSPRSSRLSRDNDTSHDTSHDTSAVDTSPSRLSWSQVAHGVEARSPQEPDVLRGELAAQLQQAHEALMKALGLIKTRQVDEAEQVLTKAVQQIGV